MVSNLGSFSAHEVVINNINTQSKIFIINGNKMQSLILNQINSIQNYSLLIIKRINGIFLYLQKNKIMKTRNIKIAMLILMALSLSNCGNKGDLYMPEKQDNTILATKQISN